MESIQRPKSTCTECGGLLNALSVASVEYALALTALRDRIRSESESEYLKTRAEAERRWVAAENANYLLRRHEQEHDKCISEVYLNPHQP